MPLVLFFLNPAISLIVAFFMNIKKQKKVFNIFILLFSLYFGYSLTPYNKQFDSYQIIQIFKNWTYLFPTFSDFLSEYIKFENPFAKDLFEGCIFFIVHSFTDNYHFIFLFCALFFTVFKLLSFDFFLQHYRYNLTHICLTIFFFTSIPLFQINGFRFYTAAWVAIYATLKMYEDKNKKYILLLLLTPFVHISFLYYIIIMAIAYLMVHRISHKKILYLFLISVFCGLIWDTLPNIKDLGDGVIGNMFNAYVNNDYKSEIDSAVEQSNFIRFFAPIKYLFYNWIVFILYIKSREVKQTNLIHILLVYLTFTNCVGFIPSMSRFFSVAYPIILYMLNKGEFYDKRFQKIVFILPFVEMFSLYQTYTTLYPYVTPKNFLLNILL